MRLPAPAVDPDPGDDAEPDKLSAYRANREVRHTIIRLIGAHLRPGAPGSWQGLNLDFTGVIFDGGDFGGAEFSGGEVYFTGAEFSGGTVDFTTRVTFSGGAVDFSQARDWSHPPAFEPGFDEASLPPGVALPTAAGPSPDTPAPTTD